MLAKILSNSSVSLLPKQDVISVFISDSHKKWVLSLNKDKLTIKEVDVLSDLLTHINTLKGVSFTCEVDDIFQVIFYDYDLFDVESKLLTYYLTVV